MPLRRKNVTYSSRPTHAARSAHARGARQFQTYDTSYIRPHKSKAGTIAAIVFALALLALLVFGALKLLGSCSGGSSDDLLQPGQTATVVVQEGENAKSIGLSLVEAKLISKAAEFTSEVKSRDAESQLKPGTYTFGGGVGVAAIVDAMVAGPSATGATIVEGATLKQIASTIEEYTGGSVSASDFLAAASDASVYAGDYSFLASAGSNSLEGFLFPKTYEIGSDATADSVIRMMLDQFQTEVAALDWSYPESQGLSVYEAVKLASIVEKESSGDEGIRAKVAAVFYNRLTTDGDPSYGYLQSDATTAYEVGHDPTAEEVHEDSSYSTYTNKGLPPTPICSPGLACLQAVCSPDADALGTYYFFYFESDANGQMQYSFSETYDEHMASFS